MALPEWGEKLISLSGGKLQLLSFPLTIYIIFLSGIGSNLIGKLVLGVSLACFLYLYAAALVALKSSQTEWNSKYNKNPKSDS
jgi:hypothetical protein